jgi:hypothetical protein
MGTVVPVDGSKSSLTFLTKYIQNINKKDKTEKTREKKKKGDGRGRGTFGEKMGRED